VEKKPKTGNKLPAIISAALQVFAEKGYHSATIAEIARKARVSEATVYEYCGSKEDLLFMIPEEITRNAVEQMEKVLPFVKGAGNRLRAIIYGYYTLYRDNPEYSALVLLDLKHNRKFMETEGYHTVRQAAGFILTVIEEGVKSGEFRDDIDPVLIRSMVLGTIEHIFFRWHLLERKEALPDFVDPLTEVLISGIKKPDDSRAIQVSINLEDGDGTAVKKVRPATAKAAGSPRK
jgi:TetR/AcrR family fatty acid metabolism transcriptional regulator